MSVPGHVHLHHPRASPESGQEQQIPQTVPENVWKKVSNATGESFWKKILNI